MKFCHSLIFPAVAAVLSLTACDSEPDVRPAMPVIEGWIDSGGRPVVLFTASVSPSASGGSLSSHIIRWGRVTVSDGDVTEVLTGGPSDEYFPPYRYYGFELKGEPGRTYRVTADYEDMHAEASCTMPFPTEIKRVDFSHVEGNDTLRSATLTFVAPDDCPAYYQILIRKYGKRPLPAMFGTFKASEAGAEVTLPLYMPKSGLDVGPYVPHFVAGMKLQVLLCRVTGPVYDFWRAYDSSVSFGGGMLVGNSSLPSLIDGGYGVWSARGVSSVYVTVD